MSKIISIKESKKQNNDKVKQIPVRNIRMMTDEEWNRLAYRNALERRCKA